MNFQAALAEVLRVTARPDKNVEATLAINKAITYCTLLGEFPKDTTEANFPINSALYGATVSISTLTRFRRFKYVKPTAVKYYLTPIGADKIFTPENQTQINRYYVAGTSMTYTLSALATSLEISYLSYPLVLDAVTNTGHWMLDLMPYAIIDLASAHVFAGVGDDTSARRLEASGMLMFLAARRDSALGE